MDPKPQLFLSFSIKSPKLGIDMDKDLFVPQTLKLARGVIVPLCPTRRLSKNIKVFCPQQINIAVKGGDLLNCKYKRNLAAKYLLYSAYM